MFEGLARATWPILASPKSVILRAGSDHQLLNTASNNTESPCWAVSVPSSSGMCFDCLIRVWDHSFY